MAGSLILFLVDVACQTCLVACLFGLHRFLECHADQFLVFPFSCTGPRGGWAPEPVDALLRPSPVVLLPVPVAPVRITFRDGIFFSCGFNFSSGIHLVAVVWHFTCGLAWSGSRSVTLRTLLSFIFPAGSPFTRKFCHCCHRRESQRYLQSCVYLCLENQETSY